MRKSIIAAAFGGVLASGSLVVSAPTTTCRPHLIRARSHRAHPVHAGALRHVLLFSAPKRRVLLLVAEGPLPPAAGLDHAEDQEEEYEDADPDGGVSEDY
jgi:hypothetical protein